MEAYTNDLINESSPYLLQHAHNPVDWHPWGEEALGRAKEEDKLLIISIGYSACHWCHVMEHESYEDLTVAKIMNEYFICVKVDREERPDIDQLYMNAAYLITGSGGWPLNVIAFPDGKPFFAGTYYPRDSWIKVLEYFIDIRKRNPRILIDQADLITKGIKSSDTIVFSHDESILTSGDLDDIFNNLEPYIDFRKGGMNRAPKFPMPSIWEFLLHYSALNSNSYALKAVISTLDNMAAGGIYDHIGGGFSRYSTDKNWHVPHFEKMIYDNAQLVSLFSHAWQLTKNPVYKDVVYQTLEFISREMTSPEGATYSSQDADSEGEEGKYYTWTYEEAESILKNEAPLFMDYYNLSKSGNWEDGKNILFRQLSDEEIVEKYKITLKELRSKLDKDRILMINARNQRIKPAIDDKILTSWNALVIKGYINAYRAFGEDRFLSSALKIAYYLVRFAINSNNEITRNNKKGRSSFPGLLDDYSFTISSFIDLYQATFDEKWLTKANELTEYAIVHFYDNPSGMFFYTPDNQSDLIARKMEITDNVIPSSNSEMASNLFKLGSYFLNESYLQRAKQMLINVQKDLIQNIYSYANWGLLGIHFVKPVYEVAILGTEWDQKRKILNKNYLPDTLYLGGPDEGTLNLLEGKLVPHQTTIYVCVNKTCKNPVTDPEKALQQILSY